VEDVVGDRQFDGLAHVEAFDDAPHAQHDGRLTAQRVALALRGRCDLGQVGLGGGKQFGALARPLRGLAGCLGRRADLGWLARRPLAPPLLPKKNNCDFQSPAVG
jgi:hypothetical protein